MNNPKISVVVPVIERYHDLRKLFTEYSQPLKARGLTFEFIFVVDGVHNDAFQALKGLRQEFPEIRIIKFARNFFEAVALMVGFEHARGDIIFTLSAYFQVVPDVMNTMLDELEHGYDLVITRREPRQDNIINRVQAAVFHGLIKNFTNFSFKDISCGLRCMRAEVAKGLNLTGDMHRFIPILAFQQGYKISELPAQQREEDKKLRFYGIGVYVRRMIDIISLFFIIKFTRKPLRFFGLIGSTVFVMGTLITAYLGYARLFLNEALADRPMVLLGMLLMVLGVQVSSLGLLGELIIFTHARNIKEYHIAEIIE
ncbi:MAG: glycosyltransferase [Candidatus Omnitrophica bacterium]|nr:glycosyltransferase [Candidatus Omnitrophota bacterium]